MTIIPAKLNDIIEKALARERLSREDCVYLLGFDAVSCESAIIRAAADRLIREKNDNAAIIIGQVGIDIHPCHANCGFCSFGKDHSTIPNIRLGRDDMVLAIENFRRADDLYGMYLMTMADTDRDYILEMVSYAHKKIGPSTQIWLNTGDNDPGFCRELRAAGARGAYHVCRVGEGRDTLLDPKVRIRSMENIRAAGLDLFSCCEPVGPEHSIEELADSIMLCVNMEPTQFGAMRRIAVPGSPLYRHGQISNLQMAHIMGCVGLVYACVDSCRFFGIHEPCESGYLSGANFVTAETGANPRDLLTDTSKGRGWDMDRCRRLLWECGFSSLLRGDESRVELNLDYCGKAAEMI